MKNWRSVAFLGSEWDLGFFYYGLYLYMATAFSILHVVLFFTDYWPIAIIMNPIAWFSVKMIDDVRMILTGE